MTAILATIAALVLVAGGAAFLVRRNKQKAVAALEHKKQLLLEDDRRILKLQHEDAVEYMGETYLVDGTLLYDEEGSVWTTYLLGGGPGGDRWLSVTDDDRLEIAWYEVLPAGTVDVPAEAPTTLTVGDISFRLDEKGSARVRKRDAMGTRDMGSCRYADYTGPDRARLAVEWWGESVEVAVGRQIHDDDLLIYPAS